jgi:hypothetical protein
VGAYTSTADTDDFSAAIRGLFTLRSIVDVDHQQQIATIDRRDPVDGCARHGSTGTVLVASTPPDGSAPEMNNIAGSTGRCSSGKDDSYPAAADDSACGTTFIASPERQWTDAALLGCPEGL